MIISLRAGAGMDGLQEKCCITVHGELDWSPGVHEQNVGRVARDGQQRSVTAYFMISNHGCDPLMVEKLGIKKAQVQGIRDDKKEFVEKLQHADGGHIRKLAEMYLAKAKDRG
jgi:SNF2 family DNA or RNA helicase